jgi:SET family sugar efflux transporter-like MFS transporter
VKTARTTADRRAGPGRAGGTALVPAAALLWGLQFSFLNPALALLLTSVYGAGPAQVGWCLAVYNAAGFAAAVVLPAVADRTGDDVRPMLGCALLTVALATALSAVTSLPAAVVALVVLGGPAGIGSTLLFAHLRRSGARPGAVVRTRALVSVAWVAGPPVATGLVGAFGPRSLLVAVGAVATGTVVTTTAMLRRRAADRFAGAGPEPPEPPPDDDPAGRRTLPVSRATVLLALVVFVVLQSANNATVSVMALLVTRSLHADVAWSGVALGVAAALEVPALLLLGRLTGRVRPTALIGTGCAAGALGYGAAAAAPSPAVLLLAQIPGAWCFAVVAGVGLTLFQQIVARPGLASGLYANTRRLGAIASGPLIALGATGPGGYRGVFAAAALLTLAVLATVPVLGRGLQPTTPTPQQGAS